MAFPLADLWRLVEQAWPERRELLGDRVPAGFIEVLEGSGLHSQSTTWATPMASGRTLAHAWLEKAVAHRSLRALPPLAQWGPTVAAAFWQAVPEGVPLFWKLLPHPHQAHLVDDWVAGLAHLPDPLWAAQDHASWMAQAVAESCPAVVAALEARGAELTPTVCTHVRTATMWAHLVKAGVDPAVPVTRQGDTRPLWQWIRANPRATDAAPAVDAWVNAHAAAATPEARQVQVTALIQQLSACSTAQAAQTVLRAHPDWRTWRTGTTGATALMSLAVRSPAVLKSLMRTLGRPEDWEARDHEGRSLAAYVFIGDLRYGSTTLGEPWATAKGRWFGPVGQQALSAQGVGVMGQWSPERLIQQAALSNSAGGALPAFDSREAPIPADWLWAGSAEAQEPMARALRGMGREGTTAFVNLVSAKAHVVTHAAQTASACIRAPALRAEFLLWKMIEDARLNIGAQPSPRGQESAAELRTPPWSVWRQDLGALLPVDPAALSIHTPLPWLDEVCDRVKPISLSLQAKTAILTQGTAVRRASPRPSPRS
jgi:hypothetical protein